MGWNQDAIVSFFFPLKYSYCVFQYYRTEERAAGWYRLTREILKLPEAPSLSSKGSSADSNDMSKASKDKSHKTRRPQPLIKLVMRR